MAICGSNMTMIVSSSQEAALLGKSIAYPATSYQAAIINASQLTLFGYHRDCYSTSLFHIGSPWLVLLGLHLSSNLKSIASARA